MRDQMTPKGLRALVNSGSEFALLDIREPAAFQAGHLLLAVNIPVNAVHSKIKDLVPRKATPIVLCGNSGQVDKAGNFLHNLGYTNINAVDASPDRWTDAGFEIFAGTYTVNNAFAIAVEQYYNTPVVLAENLHVRREAGEDIIVIDSRPFDEFNADTIPGAINLPLAELANFDHKLAHNSDSEIVVTCGGRARAILGAQSLIRSGITNPVSSLYYGTTGWNLANLHRQSGSPITATTVSGDITPSTRDWWSKIADQFNVNRIDRAQLNLWQKNKTERTPYLIDVRSQEEYLSGHVPESRWVPGGELVGLTEDYIACRNARLCLIDNGDARAILTATWMKQMGWEETVVLQNGIHDWTEVELIQREDDAFSTPQTHTIGEIPPSVETFVNIRALIRQREQLPAQVSRDNSLCFWFPEQQCG